MKYLYAVRTTIILFKKKSSSYRLQLNNKKNFTKYLITDEAIVYGWNRLICSIEAEDFD